VTARDVRHASLRAVPKKGPAVRRAPSGKRTGLREAGLKPPGRVRHAAKKTLEDASVRLGKRSGDRTAEPADTISRLRDEIRDHRPTREEAKRSAALLQKVLDTLPLGVWIIDATGRIIQGNPAGRAIWGGARLVGIDRYGDYKAWKAGTGQRVQPEEWAAFRAVTKGETILNEELEIEAFDGTRKLILSSALPIRGEGRKIIGAIAINQDVSALREAETRMRQQSALIELAHDAVIVRDTGHRIVFWNRGAEETYGWSGDEARGQVIHELLKTTWPGPPKQIQGRLLTRGHWEGELGHTRKDGVKILTESRQAVLAGPERRPSAILEINRDVTGRRRAEEDLLRLAVAVEQVTEGIAVMAPDGRIIFANPAFEAQCGLGRGGAAGLAYTELFNLDAVNSRAGRGLAEALRSGQSWVCRLTQRRADGDVCDIDVTLSPVRDASGCVTTFVAVQRDVTREVKFQERVRQWQKIEALGTLAGGIAHDFNNILLPIIINTELCLMEEKTGSAMAGRLSQVLEAARRGRDMVKQIITFSQQREQAPRPVEINPILKEALKFLKFSIPKSIKIVSRIQATPAVVMADPSQIHQALMNLCSNSAHAMRDEGGILEIGLTDTDIDAEAAARLDLPPGPYVQLSVSDTGHGMSCEVLEQVFDPFFTTKKPGEGTGMGLSVVHGIIKSYGGAITCSSEPGKGTVFNIYLPRIAEHRPAPLDFQEPLPRGTERVILVDDEEIQVRAMTKLLSHLGYHVTALTEGRKALELIRRQPKSVDLLITDQTMPGMSGEQLAREVLRDKPGLPVILCTGFSETIDQDAVLPMGVKAFVMKPFSVREIAETIRAALDRDA
jgi:PAS domain S-box-containing protein